MADEVLGTNYMFKTIEYTGDLEIGDGLELDGNTLSTNLNSSNGVSGNGTSTSPFGLSLPYEIVGTSAEAVKQNVLYVLTAQG